MPSDQLTRLVTALAGRYAVERELGHGGMATVYLADDLKHHRKVAIKVLRPELGAALGPERFTREIRIAAGLSHPHILPLHDSGEADGLLFYVMPYVRGESLRQKLSRQHQLPIDEAVRIVRQVASALDHAHAQHLVHRDIKPENILLHEGEAMVTDFGIALAAGAAEGERLTEIGFTVGTPEYTSPEQAVGERQLDARTDVYSLGCVLYEMLAGEPPFTGRSAQAIIAKRFTDPVQPVSRRRPTVPAAVDQALLVALARMPADRFASAGAFAEALSTPPASAARSSSVAVLPFLNLSADPENEFFSDGITEDVIAQLSKIRSLKVISRTSVMRFKKREQSVGEIAAVLDVATLLEGSVRRAGNRVRIVAQLLDPAIDGHLWSETYDRDLTDIFAIQTDVALQIAGALAAELTTDEKRRLHQKPTQDVQAYQLCLLGRHCLIRFTQEGIDQAIGFCEQAVARDPNYALAHCTIARAYTEIGLGFGALPSDEAFRRARAAVTRALDADSGLAEGHTMLAFLKFVCDYDWIGAEQEFKLALELDPNSGDTYDSYGLMLAALERYDEALRMQTRAHELDPLAHRGDTATTLLRAGRYDEAVREITKVLDVDPHYALPYATLGWGHLLGGQPDAGIAALKRALALSPESTLYLAQLGQALAMTGRTEEAREILRRLNELSAQRYVSPYHMAYVHVGLGEQDRAMDWLERAYAERAGGVFGVKGSFLFAPLRKHPRFRELLRKMNLAG
jgi:serine/threonine protein kinase/tetratricopeptide (TPR) repeat protein